MTTPPLGSAPRLKTCPPTCGAVQPCGTATCATHNKASDPRSEKPRPCAYCHRTLYGGPGGWHEGNGKETCADSPTTFHEPTGIL